MTAHFSRRSLRTLALALGLVVALTAAGVATASRAGSRHVRPSVTPFSAAAAVRWPTAGSSAAWIDGVGTLAGPADNEPVPIASVAKVMTAYLVLRDHPLAPGQQGPQITVSNSEAAAYPRERAAGESVVPVVAGERISERAALQALLLPSADNVAWILARWDSGSVTAFTRRMNAMASMLRMSRTHYTDPSGLDSSTLSTAADQVRLGRAAMREPTLATIVAQRTATIPAAGTVDNLDTLIGVDGIRGIKTGSTSAAGGCVLLVAGKGPSEIVAAVLGQPGSESQLLPRALTAGRSLIVRLRALTGRRR